MKSVRQTMDIITAYSEVGSYQGAAAMCNTTHRTVKRAVRQREQPDRPAEKTAERKRNDDIVAGVVAAKVKKTKGRISATRLLPEARAAGYTGSARNFRRLVAKSKSDWRDEHNRGRRPAIWSPGETLVIDWGSEFCLHVFCTESAWSRWRFVRVFDNERSETTLSMLAECFELIGGVPKVVLADRMGCLKTGVVANLVVPTPAYVRFSAHHMLPELLTPPPGESDNLSDGPLHRVRRCVGSVGER